jgi:PDZ domain
MGQRWGHSFQAVLGKEVFNDLIVDIDFPNNRIAFRDRREFRIPSDATPISLGQYLGIFTIPISIEGKPAVPAMFDLGNGGPLTVSPTYPGQAEIAQSRLHSQVLTGGVGGTQIDTIATVQTMMVGGYAFYAVPAMLPSSANTIFNSNRVFANVGLPVFSRFRVICDFHDHLVHLIPDKDLLNKPFRKDRSGVQISPKENGWQIFFVAPGSPARESGLKRNDVIVAINGRPTSQVPPSEVQAWRWGASGDQITLTLSDASTRQFRLCDYF